MLHRPVTALLLLSASFSAVSAQWDFLGKAFGTARAASEESRAAVVTQASTELTSDNWRGLVNATSEDAPEEWLVYFTTAAVNSTVRNMTFWDGVYNDTVYAASTSRPRTPHLHFGRVDCASTNASTLCNSFFISNPLKLPAFYHFVSYSASQLPESNATLEIRRVLFGGRNLTNDELPEFLVKYHREALWKDVQPWNGVLNAADGALKGVAPYLGLLLKGWDKIPNALFMIVVSFLGRQIATRFIGRRSPPEATPAPVEAPTETK